MDKKKKQRIWLIVFLFLLSIGIATGCYFIGFRDKDPEPVVQEQEKEPTTEQVSSGMRRYTVTVKNSKGSPVQGALIAFCDKDENLITSIMATDTLGSQRHMVKEAGNYGVRIMSAPYQYKLDRQVYYFAKDETTLSIVLEEDPNALVAQIGDRLYSLTEALAVANDSDEDVTIVLLGDIHVANGITLNNKNGKKITFNGNGHTITSVSNYTLFNITQKTGVTEIRNLKLSHNSSEAAFRTSNATTLNLVDVKINATYDVENAYKYCLVNLTGEGKTNLNMTRVDVKMKISTIASQAAAVVRTGNEGKTKNINITMNNCNIDLTEALGRTGVRVTKDTTAAITLNNTTINTMNNSVIALDTDGKMDLRVNNSTLGSLDPYYNANPVPVLVAAVGDETYYSLASAINAALKQNGALPIKLLSNVTISKAMGLSGTDAKIVIDGENKYKIITEGTSNILSINSNNYSLTLKNMEIVHNGTDRFAQIPAKKTGVNITLENVKLTVTGEHEKTLYPYGIFNLRGNGSLTLKSSSVDMTAVPAVTGGTSAVIRVGNAKDANAVTVRLENSKLDVGETQNMAGIYVPAGNTANIKLQKYEIHTKNKYPIYVEKGAVNPTLQYDSAETWSCEDTSIVTLCNDMEVLNLGNAAKIGETLYATLPEALAAAKTQDGEVVVKLLRNCALTANTKFDSKVNLTIDGQGQYRLTTGGSSIIFTIAQKEVSLKFKDLEIAHKATDRLVTVNDSLSDGSTIAVTLDKVNLVTANVVASSKSTLNPYCYGLINLRSSAAVTIKDSSIDCNIDGTQYLYQKKDKDGKVTLEEPRDLTASGLIRVGNGGDKVNAVINISGSSLDTSGAAFKSAVYVNSDNTATVSLTESNFHTMNQHAIYAAGTATLNLTYDKDTTWICTDTAVTSICNLKYEASIDGVAYMSLASALNEAKTKDSAVTIMMLDDCELKDTTVDLKTSGIDITIDGQGQYTLTTSHSNTGSNIFLINKANVTLRFQNMDINHTAERPLVWVNNNLGLTGTGIEVSLENVDITADYSSATDAVSGYGLFQMRSGATLTMKKVTVDFDSGATERYARGIVRLGNGGNGEGFTAFVRMEDCTIDAVGDNRAVIIAHSGNTGNITLIDTTLKTTDNYPVYNNGGTVNLKCDADTLNKSSCTSTTITSISNVTPTTLANTAQTSIDGFPYPTLKDALTDAQKMGGAVTIKLLQNCELKDTTVDLKTSGIDITIDGQGQHTLTTSHSNTGSNIFLINKANVTLRFQNMDINHTAERPLVWVNNNLGLTGTGIEVSLEDVDITADYSSATGAVSNYGLFQIRSGAALTMKKVTIDFVSGGTETNARGIVRLGNSNEGFTASIRMEDCNVNANGTKRTVIIAKAKNVGDITLINTTLTTTDNYPVFNDGGTVNLKCDADTLNKWSCTSTTITSISNVPYTTLGNVAMNVLPLSTICSKFYLRRLAG